MREKVLIFGSNFPLATRIADIVRREFEVILYEFSATNKSDQTEVSTSFTGDLLSSAVTLHKARYVVFTSESLLHIHSPSSLSALINELRTCKQLTGVYLAWVDIAEPIMAMENRHHIQVLQGESAYGKRITLLRKALEGVADSVLKVQSIYTPEDNVWSLNFLHLLFSAKNDATIEVHESIGDWEAFSADEVAEALISLLYRPSVIQLTHAPYPGGLRAFCAAATLEYRRWLVSQQTLPSANCTNQGFFAVQEHKKVPVHQAGSLCSKLPVSKSTRSNLRYSQHRFFSQRTGCSTGTIYTT
jgi:hypothetical protein